MKTNTILLSSIAVILVTPVACANEQANDTASLKEHIELVEKASNESANLQNGTFIYENSVGNNNEEHTQQTEGSFIVHDNYIDWYTKLQIGDDAGSQHKTTVETMQKDKSRYQRSIMELPDNKEEQAEENVQDWQKIEEGAEEYPPDLNEIMNVTLDPEQFEKSEVKEQNASTVYEFSYNDPYLEELKENNISESEENNVAQEQPVNPNRNIEYTQIIVTYTVDENGKLVQYNTEGTFTQEINGENQNLQITANVEIDDYNIDQLEIRRVNKSKETS